MRSSPLPQLVMSAKRSVWRMHDHGNEADKEFNALRGQILEAANYHCVYCQLQSSKYQEVHHKDDDHKNNDPRNLVCTCPLCHQVFHIGLASMREGGDLVYLPELTQVEINQLAFVMWLVGEAEGEQHASSENAMLFTRLSGQVKTLEGMLGNRRGTVLLRLKPLLADVGFPDDLLKELKLSHLSLGLIANVLRELPDDVYEQRADLLGGLRMLPNAIRFRERVEYWRTEQNAVLPVPTWYKIVPEQSLRSIVSACGQKVAAMLPKLAAVEQA